GRSWTLWRWRDLASVLDDLDEGLSKKKAGELASILVARMRAVSDPAAILNLAVGFYGGCRTSGGRRRQWHSRTTTGGTAVGVSSGRAPNIGLQFRGPCRQHESGHSSQGRDKIGG